jgi:uncharacterized membrane protein YphA (DoxX/SURF4 family)
MNNKLALTVLRITLGITFIWIGILIIQNPEAWGGYIQPWAAKLLPLPLKEMMVGTGVLDIVIGFFIVTNILTWLAGLIGAIHLVIVLITSGINSITVRDIGLLGAAVAVSLATWPKNLIFRK